MYFCIFHLISRLNINFFAFTLKTGSWLNEADSL